MKHSARRLFALAIASCAVAACGDDPPPPQPTPAAARTFDPPPVPSEPATTGPEPGTGGDDVFADEGGWENEDTGDVATGGEAATGGEVAAPVRHPGPCRVSWSGAARLRFAWDDEGGATVRIDGDRDGKSDVCAKLSAADGRTTEVRVDDGCDKSYEGKIVPTYEADTNLATAVYTETEGGETTKRELTLVALPSFLGVAPGYPLWAPKAEIKLKISKGLVRSATVKSPHEGPALKADFTYDKDGRIQRVKEDFEIDGTVDRQFDYKYDDAGNVTRVTLKMGPKGEEKKSTASLDYKCWTPAPAE